MIVSEKVRSILTSENRINIYSTSSKNGVPNIAVMGSTKLLEDGGALIVGMGENRTCANLKENPYAACLVKVEGTTGLQMDGCRLYLKVKSIQDSGDVLDNFMANLRARIGSAADMLKYVVIFEILEARPIVDMGQGI